MSPAGMQPMTVIPRSMSRGAVWLVSDADTPLTEALRTALDGRGTPRLIRCGWRHITLNPPGLPRLICWHVADPCGRAIPLLRRYGEGFYGYSSLVWVEPGRHGIELTRRLAEFGYRHIVGAGPVGRATLTALIEEALTAALFLLPGVMRALGSGAPRLAAAYAPLLADPTAARTVDGWGRLLGYRGRHGVAALHRRHGLGRPWAILSWLRLLAVLDWASRQVRRPTLKSLAERFGYSSGKYLRAHAERLTGRRLEALLQWSPEDRLELMAACLRRARGVECAARGQVDAASESTL